MNDDVSDPSLRPIVPGSPAPENVIGVLLGALLAVGVIARLVLLLT